MSNLSSILNPEANRRKSTNASNSEESMSNASEGTKEIDGSIYEHKPHPDCPDTLACLPDTNGRPQHTLPVILRCAILGSPKKRLTIREIYSTMEEKYSFYKTAGPTWKQSVRHHLSLNRLFERQPRPVTDPGFGSYWTVNLEAPPGTKRPRKRGRNKDSAMASGDQEGSAKSPTTNTPTLASGSTASTSNITQKAIKRRGRPKKASTSREDTPLTSFHDDDDGDHSMEDPPESEDGWESRDDVRPPSRRRDSLVSSKHPPYDHGRSGQPSSLAQMSDVPEPPKVVIERLRDEIENLRRQSAEAVSVSLRLSEQLAQARAEVLRSRNEIRDLEEALEDEQVRRREAERLASEEAKRRRLVDETLSPSLRSPDRGPSIIVEHTN